MFEPILGPKLCSPAIRSLPFTECKRAEGLLLQVEHSLMVSPPFQSLGGATGGASPAIKIPKTRMTIRKSTTIIETYVINNVLCGFVYTSGPKAGRGYCVASTT